MTKKVMLFTLQTFSSTGGIQKMTRTLAHSLNRVALNNNWHFKLWSAYDKPGDLMPQYLPEKDFKGFGSRLKFMVSAITNAANFDAIVLTHINLAVVGLGVKIFNPRCKIFLVAHGIEVWRNLSYLKKTLLKKCDKVICVSNFTKQQVIKLHGVDAAKCEVLNNIVDPLMALPANFAKPDHLIKRYALINNNPILFTLTRLDANEQYKGYEQVIKTISKLKHTFPDIKYIIAGKSDEEEESRVKKIIKEHQVEAEVILTGFINEDELADHFLLADLFVLPSRNEGFGIVFIEALSCGLRVVCGNADGSLDAIKNGLLGKAVDPNNINELENTITACLKEPLTDQIRKKLQQDCLFYFNETDYIKTLQQLLKYEFAG